MMGTRLERWGGGAQLLRGILAFAFPFLLADVPSDWRFTAPLVVGGVFAYVAARWLVLAEPATLRDTGSLIKAHMAEALFLSVALAVAFTMLYESLGVGRTVTTVMVLVVLAYIPLHAMALPLLSRRLVALDKSLDLPRSERPNLRRFIRGAAFVAGQTVAVMSIGLALHQHDEARRGPWDLWDVVPHLPLLLLVVGYLPIVWIEMAATKSRSTKRAEVHGAVEAMLIQAGAVLLSAFTGTEPLI